MRKLLVVLVLVAAACSGSDSADTTPAGSDTTTTTQATTTTGGDATTTTSDVQTTTTSSSDAQFAISRVVFGDDGYVSVTNVGGATGSLEGWQLCQRPAYFSIGAVSLAAGETVHFTTGDPAGLSGQIIDSGGRFGTLSADSGEMGLYLDGSFGSASSIRSYVEWGESDHGRSSVAVDAGIWDGRFVPSSGAPGLAATVDVPVMAADWATS